MDQAFKGFLAGVRVLELADELGEYCGKLLAGLGADVIKVEPIGGEATRGYGPFFRHISDKERSLYFWHYNFGKRSIEADLELSEGQALLHRLAQTADVVLDCRPVGYLDTRGLGYSSLKAANPGLVYMRITPFGDDGPWSHFKGSDLVHLALGGVMMNCGYDPEPSGFYDTPPVAPQMWQAYQIAGQMAALGIIAALNYRWETEIGQQLTTVVHEAVSMNTELDVPNWIYNGQLHQRHTGRSSHMSSVDPVLAMTKDGRWLVPYRTYLARGHAVAFAGSLNLLKKYGMQMDLEQEEYSDPVRAANPANSMHVSAAVDRLIGKFKFSHELWKEAQLEGMPWAPANRPEENLTDDHWSRRETFVKVHHPELDRSFTYVRGSWLAPGIPWRAGPRAPLIGEHTEEVLNESRAHTTRSESGRDRIQRPAMSKRGKPFALTGVRIVDLSWLLASGGAGRYFSSLGAEVIKVEHSSRADRFRSGEGKVPLGGRKEREAAKGPIFPKLTSPNQSGMFMEVNAGKRSLSLDLKNRRGKEILTQLIRDADMVIEGFSPGTMERLGFGYEALRAINPSIIYVQQTGTGQIGTLGRIRTYGPTAQALSGLTEMCGLPEPYPPAGIGYSYLDWFGAYNMAVAMMAALLRKRTTGLGCYIDSSQVEMGLYLTGTAILDATANHTRWSRFGNRSPYKVAAPNGVYRTEGDDRWIAISCFTEDEWNALIRVLGNPRWAEDSKFEKLESHVKNETQLNRLLSSLIDQWEPYALMHALQDQEVPAGVCQTAKDRCESDPQLRFLNWMVELTQTDIGRWPVKEFPVHFSETPPYMGGVVDRHGPNYGEDNHYVLSEIIGLSDQEISELYEIGAVEEI